MKETGTYDVIIVGAGFAGIGMGIHLKQKTDHSFLILERSSQIGGTWRDNRYPGAACDVPSHLYSYSFEANPKWSRFFSGQEEILAYNKSCVSKYKLQENVRTNSTVEKCHFLKHVNRWEVHCSDGSTFQTRILIGATGPLNKPQRPAFPNADLFKGLTVHSSEWNDRVVVKDKRVAVIGTGASAIQLIPAIANEVKSLDVFQRTPAWVIPRPDRDISSFEKKIFTKFPFIQSLMRKAIYWTNEAAALAFVQFPSLMRLIQAAGKHNLSKYIKDVELREKLTPKYRIGCKRILLSNHYYNAFNNPNVRLVTEGISRFNAGGIACSNGEDYPVDLIVYATGFIAAEQHAPFDIIGLDGESLKDKWKHGGSAYKGTTVAGFPNFFTMIGPNTGLGHSSMIIMMEAQIKYISDAMTHLSKDSTTSFDIKESVQNAYNNKLQKKLKRTIWAQGGCKSWYYNEQGVNTTLYPGFTFQFARETARFDVENYSAISTKA